VRAGVVGGYVQCRRDLGSCRRRRRRGPWALASLHTGLAYGRPPRRYHVGRRTADRERRV